MKHGKLFVIVMICFNLVVFYYSWRYFLTRTEFLADPFGKQSSVVNPIERIGFNEQENVVLSSAMRIVMKHENPVPKKSTKFSRIRDRIQNTNKYLQKSITIVFRDFYEFDNDLMQSIASIINLVPNIPVFIISTDIPYPPLDVFTNPGRSPNQTNWFEKDSNVRFFSLSYDITKPLKDTLPILQIRTRYTLFMPDSVRLNGRSLLSRLLREISSPSPEDLMLQQHQNLLLKQNNQAVEHRIDMTRKQEQRIIAVPFASNQKTVANCCHLLLDLPNWTLEYVTGNGTDSCDMVIKFIIKLNYHFYRYNTACVVYDAGLGWV